MASNDKDFDLHFRDIRGLVTYNEVILGFIYWPIVETSIELMIVNNLLAKS